MTTDDVLLLFSTLDELVLIGKWIVLVCTINCGLVAALIVAASVKFKIN